MSLLDKIKDIFFGGPDSWDERLKPTIKFISPEGNEFDAFWRGSPRTMDKKVGIYVYPKVAGNVTQDLDVNSARYTIRFFFEGKDNDVTANNFFAACKQRGLWDVNHPVHGFLGLQLLSIEEIDDPIESGNVTELVTEWIESVDEETLKTARELSGIIDGQSNDLNLSAAQEFANKIKQGTETLKKTIETATNGIQNLSDAVLGPLKTSVDAIDSTVNAIQLGIQDTLNATVLQVQALAGSIQNLIQLPLLANSDLESRLNTYADFQTGIYNLLPGGTETTIPGNATDAEAINNIAVNELSLTAVTVANAQIARTADNIQTRVQIIEAAEDIANQFNAMVDALETFQTTFNANDLDEQYFVQTQSYNDALLLTANAIRLLLLKAFDLKVERRFVLTRPRCPIEITVTEYGSLGDNDFNFDLFISSNKLKKQEILLLPAGKEVVIYA